MLFRSIGGASDPVEVTTPLYTESYYKKYPDGVYKTTPENAEMTYTIMDTTFPLEVFPSVLSVPLIHTRQWYRCTILLYAVTSMQIGQQVLPLQQ